MTVELMAVSSVMAHGEGLLNVEAVKLMGISTGKAEGEGLWTFVDSPVRAHFWEFQFGNVEGAVPEPPGKVIKDFPDTLLWEQAMEPGVCAEAVLPRTVEEVFVMNVV